MDTHGSAALAALLAGCGESVIATHARLGDATAVVRPDALLAVLGRLRSDPELAFEMLSDVTCVDHIGEDPRFELVYHLYSVTHNHRVRIKTRVGSDSPVVDSAVALWPSANWLEREVWDLYGVHFRGHPDPRRLLLDEQFDGHPLRKDFPKSGRLPLGTDGDRRR